MIGLQDHKQDLPQDSLPSLVARPEGPISVGGIMTIRSATQMMADEKADAERAQDQPVLRGIAGHIKECWVSARMAKENTVEARMHRNLRARRNEYDPELLSMLRQQGGSEIYMGVTSTKCRAAASWLRDVLMGSDSDKPWTISPTPIPDLNPEILDSLVEQSKAFIAEFIFANNGQNPDDAQVMKMMAEMKSDALAEIRAQAQVAADMMSDRIQDELLQGGWMTAISEFIDDLTTFPSAILKGPVIRRKPKLQWVDAGGKWVVQIEDQFIKEIERVDPFDIYPAPRASGIDDGYIIERHRMSRSDLDQLIGVEGYDDKAIRAVLSEYGRNGLRMWLWHDTEKADAEGKHVSGLLSAPDPEIDALQFWGTVSGEMLLDWGMSEDEIPDPTKEYNVEAWLIGEWVIKATLNFDPMGRKPYYKASWENIPGAFWGNSVADLVRDAAMMCNSAARALANNMGIASGPQVGVNLTRLADGEEITQMVPWKIWQFRSDPHGASDAPLTFFQPASQAAELMAVYEKFATLADETSGIPKYITGDSAPGGAGRTASGLSMMLQSAGKSIKQVISTIDVHVITPLLNRWYDWNMQFSDDETLKGDVQISAKGVLALMNKETAMVRRNEFLQLTLNSPVVQQVVGLEGVADLLREMSKGLDMDSARLVPPIEQLRKRWAQEAEAQAMLANAQQGVAPGQGGSAPGPGSTENNAQKLMDGSPITDNFSTQAQA